MDEEIADDEVLYRRVAKAHQLDGVIMQDGLLPHRVNDVDGILLSRARFDTPEAMVERTARKNAAVFAVTVAEIRSLGLSVVASPLPDQPGHCHIPELNSANRKLPETLLLATQLAKLLMRRPVHPAT